MDYLLESVKTIRSLCEIAVVLRNLGREDLLPTVLEIVLLEAQDMVDEYCVEEE